MEANKHAKLCSYSFHPCALQGRALRHFHFSRSNSRDFPFIFCLPSSSSCSDITNSIQPSSPETQASWKWFSCVNWGCLRAFAVMEDQSAQLDGKGCACGEHVSECLYNNCTRYCKNMCLQTLLWKLDVLEAELCRSGIHLYLLFRQLCPGKGSQGQCKVGEF